MLARVYNVLYNFLSDSVYFPLKHTSTQAKVLLAENTQESTSNIFTLVLLIGHLHSVHWGRSHHRIKKCAAFVSYYSITFSTFDSCGNFYVHRDCFLQKVTLVSLCLPLPSVCDDVQCAMRLRVTTSRCTIFYKSAGELGGLTVPWTYPSLCASVQNVLRVWV